jgi:amino acid adenylation domain-containing protein/thioester reductase-like protein
LDRLNSDCGAFADNLQRKTAMSMAHDASVPMAWNGHVPARTEDEGLDAQFERQTRARPDAVAVDGGAERLTYAELSARASRMAHALRGLGVGEETPVGVFMGPRIEQIVAQVAIARVGATYVPLDPEYPRERLEFMLADAAIEVVITGAGEHPLAGRGVRELCVDRDAAAIAAHPDRFDAPAGGGGQRTHILYTSGSTGKPKGIEVVARAVTRLVVGSDYVEVQPDDGFAQIANFSFDAAIFEVWGPLLNGARVVMIPRGCVLDPQALTAALAQRRVTVMFMTTALFNLVAQADPDAFAPLRHLLVGGERADARAMRAVLRAAAPQRFLHVYGPTEGTTFSTACLLDPGRVATSAVPIGRPIRGTTAYILDAALRPVAVGEPGELCVGGEGLARGYLRRPELTAERFVEVAGLSPCGPVRLYRTGDQARWLPTGEIEFLGRTDFQVKIRGFRVELEEIEATLVATGTVRAAAVTVQESAHGDKSLVAHVVPREPTSFRPAALQQQLAEKLPPYMVPARFLVRAGLPLSANGKIDRKALAADVGPAAGPRDALEVAVGALWAAVLGVPSVAADDDFFALGGTSLLAARLVLQVREALRVDFPVYALYESGRLRDFVAVVRAAQRGVTAPSAVDGPATWRADATLPLDVRATIRRSLRPLTALQGGLPTGARVLLTGATGFLGAFLLRDLVVRARAQVHCLVRASDEREGLARVRAALDKYGLWHESFARHVIAVPGDLRLPRFGLDEGAFVALAGRVDAVVHSAAQVSYVQPYSAHRPSNVCGTAEVIRLAATGVHKPLHHVSSIAVFGPSGFFGGGPRVREDQDLDEHLEYLRYDIGYSASKWVAEKLVWEAGRLGLPVRVYRPGFIMGDSRSGAGNPDDFVGRLVRGAIQVGLCPDLPRQRKEFVPVDYVSRSILTIAARDDSLGKAFHLVPPDPARSVDHNDFFALIRECGYPLETCSYARWVDAVIEDCRTRDNPLCSLIPMLFERVYREHLTRWELYADMPVYDVANAVAALAGSDVEHVAMDRPLVARYLRHWISTGHVPPPRRVTRAAHGEPTTQAA